MFAKFAKLGVLAVALTVGLGAAAQAGQPPHQHQHGHTHDGYGIPRGPHGGYGPSHSGYHGGYVPQRNHSYYVPGHYDVHRSGHGHW